MAQAREADTYVVDCDAHVLEPPDLWERYLENKYKDRAIKIVTEEDGRESLVIDNGPHALTGRLAVLGGVLLERSKLWTPETEYVKYLDGAPRPSMYGPDRLKLFDASGIDAGIVAPTIGLVWETDDVGLGNAYARAYNTWLYEEFAAADPKRLLAVAHLHLKDVDTALKELRLRIKQGFRGVFIGSERVLGKGFAHPDFDPIWRELEDSGLPVIMHIVVHRRDRGLSWISEWYDEGQVPAAYTFGLGAIMQIVPAVTTMILDGLFDRFPKLKVLCIEAGAGWAPYLMHRLDTKYHHFDFTAPLELGKPSEYFHRNLWFSAEPEERTINNLMDVVGEERILWGSDYPHIDSHTESPNQIRESVAGLSKHRQGLVLGKNARTLLLLDR